MIIDRAQLAGLDAYLQEPSNPGVIDLAGLSVFPVRARTTALPKGRQLEISGVRILMEGQDLGPMFQFQRDSGGSPFSIFQVSIVKEMFPDLYADPFRHRVHNVAGNQDFREGTLKNGTIMEIEGVPTIVSLGKGVCQWISKVYRLPGPITIDGVAWELATSRLSPAESFRYQIVVDCRDGAGNAVGSITSGTGMRSADQPRVKDLRTSVIRGVSSLQVTFKAEVKQDSTLMERQLPTFNESVGRPLLRAVNVLELLGDSIYDIHSLTELEHVSRDMRLNETPGPQITRATLTLDLNAILVSSETQDSAGGRFESVALTLHSRQFNRFEARLVGDSMTRVD
jgi:hypothetical protein